MVNQNSSRASLPISGRFDCSIRVIFFGRVSPNESDNNEKRGSVVTFI
jgi:hypothetical protein